MRIISLALIMVSVSCAQAPQMGPKSTKTSSTAVQPAKTQSAQDAVADSTITPENPIAASEVAAVMTASSAPVEGTMDMAAMEEQVQAVFAQSNLSPEKSAVMSEQAMALIVAANAGDQLAVTKLSNDLVQQAVGKSIVGGFGLVDVAGIVQAIMDCIAAVLALDVAGVLAALMDLVAAVAV